MNSLVPAGSESPSAEGVDSHLEDATNESTVSAECGAWASYGDHAHGTGAGPC